MKTMKWAAAALFLLLPTSLSVPIAPAAAQSAQPNGAMTADAIWNDLLAGNERFVEGKQTAHEYKDLRRTLSKTQSPKVVVLGCSDSRVSPELLFDKNLGELFVVRTAGNIAGKLGIGSIEYAVAELGSSVLVVLGHSNCGAVKAACSGEKMPTDGLDAIVTQIKAACAPGKTKEALEASVEANVRRSASDILAQSDLLRKYAGEGKLTVITADYDLESGRVTKLK